MSIKKDHVIITSEGETKEEVKMFSSSGQLNAKSLQDALQALIKYAKMLEENDPDGTKKKKDD